MVIIKLQLLIDLLFYFIQKSFRQDQKQEKKKNFLSQVPEKNFSNNY